MDKPAQNQGGGGDTTKKTRRKARMLTERKRPSAGERAATTWCLSQAQRKVPVPVANGAAAAWGRTALPPGGRRRALRARTVGLHKKKKNTSFLSSLQWQASTVARVGGVYAVLCFWTRKDCKRGLWAHTDSQASSPMFSPWGLRGPPHSTRPRADNVR